MKWMSWLWMTSVPDVPLKIRCEHYVNAGIAALAAGGCSGHWMVCQQCKYEWKDRLEPDPYGGRRWYWCPRCTVQELGSRILGEYVKRLNTQPEAQE